jgi:D-sedoheptulose 7-phosphate isomerase
MNIIKNILKEEVKQIINIFKRIQNQEIDKNFVKLCEVSITAIKKRKKIIFFGNGGSAADAQHLATELTSKYKKIRKALPALALTTDTSALTSIGNTGDVSIAITTSVNSENLIEAMKIAKKRGIKTFCFSGNKGGKIKKFVKYPIILDSNNTSVLQVIEIALGQVYCNIIENFFLKNEKN